MRQAATAVVEMAPPPANLEGIPIPDLEDRIDEGAGADELTVLRKKLEAAVRSVCPYWMHDQHQDIVQVAMIAVLKHRDSQPGRHFPLAYLRKAAYTAMIDEIRRRRRRGEVPLEAASDEVDLVEGRANPERRCSAGEIAEAVRSCLQRLASPRRAAVTLHLLGYRVPEIAEKMSWKPKQADNLVYRGMDDLRRCLVHRGLEP